MKLKSLGGKSFNVDDFIVLVDKLNDLDKTGERSPNLLEKFWNDNSCFIGPLVSKKFFTRSQYDHLKVGFNSIVKIYNWDYCDGKVKFLGDNELFRKICLDFLKLSFQFNEYDFSILEYFNPSSLVYKRIKAIFTVRSFRGSSKEFLPIFNKVTGLLYDIIESEPNNLSYGNNLAVECLNVIFPKINNLNCDGYSFQNTTISEKISIIVNFGDVRFLNQFLYSSEFQEWIFSGNHKYDQSEYDVEGLSNILKSIVNDFSLSDEDLKKANFEIKKSLKEYSAYLKLRDETTKNSINFLKKQKYYFGGNVDSLNGIDVKGIFEKVKNKYFGELLDEWGFYVCGNDVADDIRTFLGTKLHNAELLNTKNLLVFFDELPKERLVEIQNDVDKLAGFEFMVINMPKELRIVYNISRLQNDITFTDTSAIVGYCVGLYLYIYDLNSKYFTKKDNLIVSALSNSEDVDKLLKIIEEKDKLLHEKEIFIGRYIEQTNNLKKEISELTDKLKKSGIVLENDNNYDSEALLFEKRRYYRIVVVGGSDHSIKGYKNMMKNVLFINKLEKFYHLSVNQFDLKGTYDMQKDKKFAKQIQDSLDFGTTDFIIVLQSDHETALFNLINDPYYSTRVTYFGELDEDGKITKINQKFSPEKFDLYLEKALKKYEKVCETNSKLFE